MTAVPSMPALPVPDLPFLPGLGSVAVIFIAVAVAELGAPDRSGRSGGFRSRLRARMVRSERIGRPEEILEVAEIVDAATDRLVAVLQRSGAARLHDPQTLREFARDTLDLAAVDIASRAFGTPMHEGPDRPTGDSD